MRAGVRFGVMCAVVVLTLPGTVRAQGGLYLPGGGAAHTSMGGVSTATPVDAIGALYWNPAAAGRLGHSEVSIGGAFLYPNFHLDSTGLGQNGLQSGRTRSDSGMGIASSLGVVYQPEDSQLTYGMGLMTLGGGAINFPGDVGNPVLSGIGPLGNVQGPIASNLILLQLTPTVAYKVTDRLVVGLGPTIDVAITSFDPAFFAPQDDANGDGIGTFPTASHSRPFWGGGVRAGLVYSITDRIDVGFGYTSPQWYETWKFRARTELGQPQTLTLDASLPAIYSWGVAYRPTDRLLLGVDLRYLDYANTELYGNTLAEGGLGWQGVFAAAVGGRYQATDRLALSAGYVYNDNPIPSVGTLFNVQAPLITQHMVSVGTTLDLTDRFSTSIGYAYAFHNSISGPIREAIGIGTKLDAEIHMITFSMQFKFGPCGCKHEPVTSVDCCGPATSAPVSSYPTDPTRMSNVPPASIGG